MLEGLRFPAMDAWMQAVTELGSEALFLVAALVLFWCVSKQDGYYLLTVGFFGTVLNQFLKLLCRIPRPWVPGPCIYHCRVRPERALTGYSFPSGQHKMQWVHLAYWLDAPSEPGFVSCV